PPLFVEAGQRRLARLAGQIHEDLEGGLAVGHVVGALELLRDPGGPAGVAERREIPQRRVAQPAAVERGALEPRRPGACALARGLLELRAVRARELGDRELARGV